MAVRKIIASLIIIFLLSGCVEKEILDDVSIETGVAYDLGKDKTKIIGTALIPFYLPDKTVENEIYTATSLISRDFVRDMQRQSSDPIVTGSLEVALFGKNLAEEGIIDVIDSFQRDPSIGATLFLATVDGEAKNVIKGDYGKRGNAVYISNLIKHNIDTKDLPETNLQRFLSALYSKGMTPYLPTLRKIGKDKMEVSGITFFKKDKAVDSINANKMFFFKLLVQKYSEGSINVNVGNKKAVILSVDSKYKKKLIKRKPYEIDIELKLKGILSEYSGVRFTKKELAKVEKALEKRIEKETLSLIAKFKDKDIDPIGFGHFVKSETRNFNFKEWNQSGYKNLKVNVNADVMIIESGVIE